MINSWLQYSFLYLGEGPDRRMVWGEEELGNPTGCPVYSPVDEVARYG
jgi:hypothetical protein